MRPSMLYNYSNKAGTIYPYLSVRTCWRVIGNIAILRAAHVQLAAAAADQLPLDQRTTCHYCYNATLQPQGRPQAGEIPPVFSWRGGVFSRILL